MNLKIRQFFFAKPKVTARDCQPVKRMVLLRKLTVALLMLTCLEAGAKDIFEVTGKVSDENGKPMQGASVKLLNTAKGTSTDADGNFILEIPAKGGKLVISFVGFDNLEIPVSKAGFLKISLKQSESKAEEVVVIGYGTQKKSNIAGAVSSISSKEYAGTPVTGFDQALQGRIAGVQVTQNSGQPGGNVSIRIRGVGSINSSNEPLYVVDGVPFSSLNSINPNDIERIDVLKDAASASIYGSRATNGVVLITTKRAKAGKLSVSVDGYAGVQSIAKKLELLDGHQFAKLANENLVNGGIPANPSWSKPEAVQNTDWQDAVLRNAPIQNYNISISGGGEKASTLFSFGYYDQDGIVVGSDYKRYTLRLNTDYNISNKLKVGITLNGSFEEKNPGNGVLGSIYFNQPTSPIYTTQNGLFGYNPDGSIKNNDSTFYGENGYAFMSRYGNVNYYPGTGNNLYNTTESDYNTQKQHQLLGAIYGEYELVSGLKFRSTINMTLGNSFNVSGYPAASPGQVEHSRARPLSAYTEYWDKTSQWNWINTLSYQKSFGDHTFSAVAGMDALNNDFRFANIATAGVPNAQPVINGSDPASRVASGYPTSYALMSYIGRVSYDYKGKYLLSASVRRDGSTKFGPKNQFATFPSASIAWKVSEEDFLKSSDLISDLKIRASYGSVGNQNIPNFKYLTTYSNDGGTYQYVLGSSRTPQNGYYADNIGDSSIRWEKSTQVNIGMDIAFLNNKITFTGDYYTKEITDMLGNFPVPIYTGVFGGNILKNGFSMINKGFEFSLGYNEKIGNVRFSANANLSTVKNEITQLTDNEKGYIAKSISVGNVTFNDGGAQTRTVVGDRIGNFYGYVTNGIIQNANDLANSGLGGVALGDRMFKDMNGDKIINDADKVVLGNGLPKYIYGLNLKAEYKGFDLSVFLNGQGGVQIANMLRYHTYQMRWYNSTGIINGSTELLNSWTGPGSTNEMPRNSYTAPTSNRWFSTYYIEDGSFLRIKNIQLGYTLPQQLTRGTGISRARFFVTGQNLYTFTNYSGYDPEIGSPGQSVLETGVDYGRYPSARTFIFGINCQF